MTINEKKTIRRLRKKQLPKFKTKKEEADFWMTHDTTNFWDFFEDIKEPIEIAPNL